MKKFLLSILGIAALGFAANAAEVTFDFATETYGLTRATENTDPYIESGTKATNGDVTITLNKKEGSNGWRLWTDGLRAYKNSDVSMVFSADGGTITGIKFADAKSGVITGYKEGDNEAVTVKGTGFEIACDGTEITLALTVPTNGKVGSITVTYTPDASDKRLSADLSFPEASYTVDLKETFTAPELTKATTAAVTYTSSNEEVATVDATTGAVTLVGEGSASITATAEENTEYKAGTASYSLIVIDGKNFVKASELVSGAKYLLAAEDVIAAPITGKYGYLPLGKFVTEGEKIVSSATNAFTITAVEGGYNIQDASGFYYYQTGDFNSFNRAEEIPAEGAVWSIALENGVATIVNLAVNKTVSYSAEYKSWGSYPTTEGYVLPTLYVLEKEENSVENIAADANAPVEYFNLQGVRVANPENGLYIRRQGNTVTKVLVK